MVIQELGMHDQELYYNVIMMMMMMMITGMCPCGETTDLHPLCRVRCGGEDYLGMGSPCHAWSG